MRSFWTVKNVCLSAVVASLYAALSLAFQAISYGAVPFRGSEALTLVHALLPQAIPGLTLGCLIANLFNPLGATPYDVVFGSLATLLAAALTWRLRGPLWIKALPPVLVNALIIGAVLTYAYGLNVLWLNVLTVGLGQAGVCYALGIPLVKLLERCGLARLSA